MVRKVKESFLLRLHPLQRVLISFFIGGLVCLFFSKFHYNAALLALIFWVAFSFAYLIASWAVILQRSTEKIKVLAQKEDGSRVFVLVAIIAACIASLCGVLIIILPKGAGNAPEFVSLPVGIATMMLSWAMVHSTFTFHYANLFYSNRPRNKPGGGLQFPGNDEPAYLDFAYFSFVIGMTFQVSDVEVSNTRMRRLVLLHGLLSFMLNTFVVALTVNAIAGLIKG